MRIGAWCALALCAGAVRLRREGPDDPLLDSVADVVEAQEEIVQNSTQELQEAQKAGGEVEQVAGLEKDIATAEQTIEDAEAMSAFAKASAGGVLVDSLFSAMFFFKNAISAP